MKNRKTPVGRTERTSERRPHFSGRMPSEGRNRQSAKLSPLAWLALILVLGLSSVVQADYYPSLRLAHLQVNARDTTQTGWFDSLYVNGVLVWPSPGGVADSLADSSATKRKLSTAVWSVIRDSTGAGYDPLAFHGDSLNPDTLHTLNADSLHGKTLVVTSGFDTVRISANGQLEIRNGGVRTMMMDENGFLLRIATSGTDDSIMFTENVTRLGSNTYIDPASNNSVVGGGLDNSILYPADYAVVSGGRKNTASHDYTTVSGGIGNHALGQLSTVGGGSHDTASGTASTVSGGVGNWATGNSSCVPGGQNNQATGSYSFAFGNGAIAGTDTANLADTTGKYVVTTDIILARDSVIALDGIRGNGAGLLGVIAGLGGRCGEAWRQDTGAGARGDVGHVEGLARLRDCEAYRC